MKMVKSLFLRLLNLKLIKLILMNHLKILKIVCCGEPWAMLVHLMGQRLILASLN